MADTQHNRRQTCVWSRTTQYNCRIRHKIRTADHGISSRNKLSSSRRTWRVAGTAWRLFTTHWCSMGSSGLKFKWSKWMSLEGRSPTWEFSWCPRILGVISPYLEDVVGLQNTNTHRLNFEENGETARSSSKWRMTGPISVLPSSMSLRCWACSFRHILPCPTHDDDNSMSVLKRLSYTSSGYQWCQHTDCFLIYSINWLQTTSCDTYLIRTYMNRIRFLLSLDSFFFLCSMLQSYP